MKRLVQAWPHIGFWLAFALVVVNALMACFAPVPQIRLDSIGNAGLCGLAALIFWIRCEGAR